MTQIYIDHQLLAKIAGSSPEKAADSEDYLAFLGRIRRAVEALPENHSKVITAYYFETRVIDDIAEEIGLPEEDTRRILREGLLKLKHALADEVKTRWPDRFGDIRICPICNHPERVAIETLIKSKKRNESWGVVNRRLKSKFGVSFNPPSVIISHMKYHTKDSEVK